MTKQERQRHKEVKRLLKIYKKDPRYLELKRKKHSNEKMSREEINELTHLYIEHTSLLNEDTKFYLKKMERNTKIVKVLVVLSSIALMAVIIIKIIIPLLSR